MWSVGCQGVQRSLEITSQPSGALVHVNDVEVGRTPVSVPFTHYGTYDVRVAAEGYRPLWTQAEAKVPLWDLPGPDLVAEAVGGESTVQWHFDLEPMPEQTERTLVSHARQMRALLRQEAEAPASELTPAP